jgi:FkbM family methyltransferase
MPITPSDHPLLREFERWEGRAPAGFLVDFLGQKTDIRFVEQWNTPDRRVDRYECPSYPPATEETFELLAILKAVTEAGNTFTMVELGAGFGRWLLAGACAARAKRPELRIKLVGVEAEPTHYQYLKKHVTDNGFDPAEHMLIEAAVNGTGQTADFIVGHAETWYGQAIVPPGFTMKEFPNSVTIKMRAIRLSELLASSGFADIVDMDIQGAEREVVPEAIEALTSRVRRVTIGTHSDEIHELIGRCLLQAGWRCDHSYLPGKISETEFGHIHFQDGVHSWTNPRLP